MQSSPGSFIILDSVDSTNNYAMGMVQKGMAEHGSSYLALEQYAGKGRLGKAWKTEPGANLMMSIVVRPGLNVSQQFQLSASVAVATHRLLTKYIEEVKIKWPNDLYWRDRKTGGILIENVLKGQEWEWSIIGIGINVNQIVFPAELPNPVSIKQITQQEQYVIPLGKLLREEVLNNCAQLLENGFEEIYQYYNENLYKAGEVVRLKKSNAIFETKVKGVETDGMLTVIDTMERSFNLDEIEWVI